MANYSDLNTITDSFRFYIMLGIQVSELDPKLGDRLIREFKKELLNNNYRKEHIEHCAYQASITLPADFNYLHGIPSVSFKEI